MVLVKYGAFGKSILRFGAWVRNLFERLLSWVLAGTITSYSLYPQTRLSITVYTNDKRANDILKPYSNRAALQKRKGTMCRRSAGYAAPKVSLYQRVLATARPER